MEMMYQYLWQQRMLGKRFSTVRGESVDILYAGRHNRDAGPDFLNARVRIGDQEWAGNVEIHVKASDWHRHGHDSDPAYSNVILHVVAVDDARITRADGSEIPQILATFPESFFRMYLALSQRIMSVPCQPYLGSIPELNRVDWLSSLAVERIQDKAHRILECVRTTGGDWNQACFISLARALGFNLNSEPFEILARSLPLNILFHHSDNIMQLEALLFGQAGMLDTSLHIFDEYYQLLGREYFFLARKYGLRPMNVSLWKYARTRPQNFPHRRIALLCRVLYNGFTFLSDVLERRRHHEALRELLDWQADGYWETHADFDIAGNASAALSPAAVDLLMINLIAPLLYAYGSSHGDADMADDALDIWYGLPPENNTFIRQWSGAGIKAVTAAESQALLQLRKKYCDMQRCMDCRFASNLLHQCATG